MRSLDTKPAAELHIWDKHPNVLAGTVVVLAVLAFVLFAINQVPISIKGQPDFPNYYLAGERLREGTPVYDEVVSEVLERFGVAGAAHPADPPPTVVLLAPLSLLPFEVAWLTLAGISTFLVPFVVYRVSRDVNRSTRWALVAASLALVSTNFRFLIASNHMESLILAAGYLGWRSLRRGNEEAGGLWWGIATGLKLFPGLWLVGVAASRRKRAVIVGTGTAALLILAGAAVVGWQESWRFVTEVVPRSERWYGALGNYSVLSFGTALVGKWFGWLLTAAVAAVGISWFLRRPGGPDRVWSAGTALALLLSPLSWHNYLVLTFPVLVLLASQIEIRTMRQRIGFAALVAGLGFWGPIVMSSEAVSVLLSFVPTYALAALFVMTMREGADRWTPTETVSPISSSRIRKASR